MPSLSNPPRVTRAALAHRSLRPPAVAEAPSDELNALLDQWHTLPKLSRRPCPCGRAFVIDGERGRPCELCIDEAMAEHFSEPRCRECGDSGWVPLPDAVCYANEWEAIQPCPNCSLAYYR